MNQETQPAFRVGGRYKNGCGAVGRLELVGGEIWHALNYSGARIGPYGADGSYHGGIEPRLDLIPDDAQGEPIAPTFYCAAETIKGESTGNRLVTIAELCADMNRNVGAVEPMRPALTWADSKPFDAFDGFKVKRDTAPPDHTYSHPLTRVADAGAQTPPVCGSAWLVVR